MDARGPVPAAEPVAGLPPQDLEAEEAVLGAMVLNEQAIDVVLEMGLAADDFYRPAHQAIFSTILRLHEREPVDQLTLVAQLKQDGLLEQVGGQVAVVELVESVPAVSNARHYADIVRRQSVLRGLVRAGTEIARLGYEHPDEPEKLVDHAEQLVYDLGQTRTQQDFVRAADVLPGVYDELSLLAENGGSIKGIPSGFRDFDEITGGFQPSNLIIVGARPSMGKTAFALNIAEHVALKEQKPIAVFSLEMSRDELVTRVLSSVAKVDQYRVKVTGPREDDWPRLLDAYGKIEQARDTFFIDDAAGLSPMALRSKARRLHSRMNLGMIIIDYLQLMEPGMRIDNRQEQVSFIARSLKMLARELNIPVMALSQLSRGIDQRPDKRPVLSDLRESGAIEQDADIVLFLHREEYYDRDNPETKGKAEVIIAKNRNGRIGSVDLAFLGKYTKFVSLAKTTTPPAGMPAGVPGPGLGAPQPVAPMSGPPVPAGGPPPLYGDGPPLDDSGDVF